jgi:DNA-directed RNA polymerase subunit RPC12/RpoP
MSIKFSCASCGHHLKAYPEQAGKQCKCTRCGHTMTVPTTPPVPVAVPAKPTATPVTAVSRKSRFRLILGGGVAAAVLAGGIVLAVFLYAYFHQVDQGLNDLSTGTPEARAKALLWLAEADPQDSHRARVTATLEPLLFEGDVRGSLDSDLLLRAYLHWANKDNVPSLIRMVENPILPSWNSQKTGLVMATLGKLQDGRAADVLARKLSDPELHDQAADALKVLGPNAEGAVLDYLFVDDPATQQRASDLLASYGTPPKAMIAEARRRLTSNDPEERRSAAAWFAENPPDDDFEKGKVAGPLIELLGDLSPKVNGLALRGLKLWATRDCLPQVVEFARRQEKAGPNKEAAANNSALIDVLATFPDETAAEALALRLKDPEQRGKAAQALLKLGPKATGPVLRYLNHPDPDVRKEARSLCRLLNIPADRQLEQTLADVADTSKPRSRAALEHLAQLRPDEASRVKVSKALNAPLLDPDAGIREGALDAVRVWATQENAATLLKLLGDLPAGRTPADARATDRIIQAVIAIGPGVEDAVIPLLKSPDGLIRREACGILTEVGTNKSVQPVEAAGQAYLTIDAGFYRQTQLAVAKIMARK